MTSSLYRPSGICLDENLLAMGGFPFVFGLRKAELDKNVLLIRFREFRVPRSPFVKQFALAKPKTSPPSKQIPEEPPSAMKGSPLMWLS
jgi:hypothetical protein